MLINRIVCRSADWKEGSAGVNPFGQSFILSKTNILLFISQHTEARFKYIFRLGANELALGDIANQHKIIANETFNLLDGEEFYGLRYRGEKGEVIGGWLSFIKRSNGIVYFSFLGRSGYFDSPNKDQLEKLRDHMVSLLNNIGIHADADEEPGEITIRVDLNSCERPVS